MSTCTCWRSVTCPTGRQRSSDPITTTAAPVPGCRSAVTSCRHRRPSITLAMPNLNSTGWMMCSKSTCCASSKVESVCPYRLSSVLTGQEKITVPGVRFHCRKTEATLLEAHDQWLEHSGRPDPGATRFPDAPSGMSPGRTAQRALKQLCIGDTCRLANSSPRKPAGTSSTCI